MAARGATVAAAPRAGWRSLVLHQERGWPMIRSRNRARFKPFWKSNDRRQSAPLSLEVLETRMAPAVFTVNSLSDTVAVNLVTGVDSTGHITLRSAIQSANNLGGSNTINLPAGIITLTIAGAGEDNAATGDLDIKNNLAIGAVGPTTVNANSL